MGGIELQVHDLAARQAAAGHEVTVFTTTVGPEPAELAPRGAVVRLGGSGGGHDLIRYRRSARGRHIALDGEFDVVHVHASSFSPLAFLAAHQAARQGIPTVATVHSLWAKSTPLFWMADRLTGWGDWPLAWSAVSSAAALQLHRILGGRAEVTILPNGVEPEYWRGAATPVSPDELRIAAVGRLAPRKRPLRLAQILHAARRRLPEGKRLWVDIVGDGPERGSLERYLRRHAMTDWVRLRGRLSRAEIRTTFARAHLFVSPAVLESFGIAALEARCAGLPIVARAGTGVQDFVAHEREGWLVDSDDALADTIVSLAAEPDRLAAVRLYNRTVPPSITWATVLGTCDELYRVAAFRQGTRLDDAGQPASSGRAVSGR